MKRIITFGTFDLFHIGHLNILRRARELGDYLAVGVSSDELNLSKKSKQPISSADDRLQIVSAIRYVDEVFVEESLELKGDYLRKFRADVLVMGDDWVGLFDEFREICEVVYLPRTENISTTSLKSEIQGRG